MRHKRFLLASLLGLFFALTVLISCEKGNECTGVIYTYIENDAGVKIPLGGCELVFKLEKVDEREFAPEIQRTVVTDASGRYEGIWTRQVRIPIEATKSFNEEQYYFGVAFIDLIPGQTTESEIVLSLKEY